MICGKACTKVTNLEDAWEKALKFVKSDKRVSVDVQTARALNPSQMTDTDFLRQCAWAILGARRRYEVLEKRWPDIERVFFKWNISTIVEQAESVKTQALQVLNSPRKVDGVIEIARWLKKREWPAVHAELLSFVAQDKRGNPVVTDELLKWLDQLPGVGRTLASYVVKDLGIGSIKDDIWMRRLAEWLGYSPDSVGVRQMALDIQVLSNEKINVIDTVLWNWTRTQEWLEYVSTK